MAVAAGGSRGWKTIQAGFSPSGTGTLRALRPGSLLLSSPVAPRDPPGQTKPKGAPVKRPQKTKAIQAQKLRNSAKGKVPKSALDEYRKRECRDHLRVNLKFLTRTRSSVAESVSQQILRQNRGRKACDRPVAKTKKKKKAEGTVFTEEDFQKFQQEYFGS
uniref:Active regulator of SIRT1 n=1 Tax=Chlorocebus sabaeus TaxID=60711 RepID=A0A0D9R1X8_CHLSB